MEDQIFLGPCHTEVHQQLIFSIKLHICIYREKEDWLTRATPQTRIHHARCREEEAVSGVYLTYLVHAVKAISLHV